MKNERESSSPKQGTEHLGWKQPKITTKQAFNASVQLTRCSAVYAGPPRHYLGNDDSWHAVDMGGAGVILSETISKWGVDSKELHITTRTHDGHKQVVL